MEGALGVEVFHYEVLACRRLPLRFHSLSGHQGLTKDQYQYTCNSGMVSVLCGILCEDNTILWISKLCSCQVVFH